MSLLLRRTWLGTTACMILATAACVATPVKLVQMAAGSQVAVEGTIVTIDTKPWAHDGNAVVLLQTAVNGKVQVHLPARWNLCKAAPVNVSALMLGQVVQAVGTVGPDGEVVVCDRAEHRLAPLEE